MCASSEQIGGDSAASLAYTVVVNPRLFRRRRQNKRDPLDYDGQRVFSFPTTAFLIADISSQRKTILMTTMRIVPSKKVVCVAVLASAPPADTGLGYGAMIPKLIQTRSFSLSKRDIPEEH